MEISVNNNTIPEKWVDFEWNPGLAIACLVEAFNERLFLLDNNGFATSGSMKFAQGFTAFDYDIILYLRDGISVCLSYFYDLDYDEKHLEEHEGSLKMLDLNSFDKDTVDKFINIPPRGSLIGSFKDFYGACKAILQKMTAIHFTGDVYSLKEHYTSGAFSRYTGMNWGNQPSQPPEDWYNMMLSHTLNFSRTCVSGNPRVKGDTMHAPFKIYCVYGSGNIGDLVCVDDNRDSVEIKLRDIDYYRRACNVVRHMLDRYGSLVCIVHEYSNVSAVFFDFVENKAKKYFDRADIEYMKSHVKEGKYYDDGNSMIMAFNRFKECVKCVGEDVFEEDDKKDIDYIVEYFFRKIDYEDDEDKTDFVVFYSTRGVWDWNLGDVETFLYYDENSRSYFNFVNEKYSFIDRDSNYDYQHNIYGQDFFEGFSCHKPTDSGIDNFSRSLHCCFYGDMNKNEGCVYYRTYSSDHYTGINCLWNGLRSAHSGYYTVVNSAHSYGASNPLMFTANMEYLTTVYKTLCFYNACFKKDAVKILYIDNKNKNVECDVKIRYSVTVKKEHSLFETFEYGGNVMCREYDSPYGFRYITPKNLPKKLKIGWHKGPEFKWSEKINMDWIDANEWIPDEEDMKSFGHGIGLCGIDGEIYIILDYKNGLKFK